MKNKSSIGIVIDSTTTLDPQLIKDYGIKMVSLNVHTKQFNKKETETADEEIISQLDDVKNLSTSSPSPLDFAKAYNALFDEGYKSIICLPLSKEISSTFQSAILGKTYVKNSKNIFVGNSLYCNFGLANIIETMLPMFEKSTTTLNEVSRVFKERNINSDLQFSVLNLKHLVNGGRLSKIAGLLGSILHVKPIIQMKEGKLKLAKKEINMTKVINVFMTAIKGYADKFKEVFVKIVDLTQNDVAEKIVHLINVTFPKIHTSRISTVRPTFFIHLGNSGVGFSVVAFD
ncbi:MAG: DegV family protein [Bacilli bacterium]